MRSISYLGHSARRVFHACEKGDGVDDEKAAIIRVVQNIPPADDFSKLLSDIYLPNNTSHSLFELSCDHPRRLFIYAQYHAASPWILDQLLLAYERREQDAAWKFYNVIAGNRDAASLKGRIWERQVHNFFHSRAQPYTLAVTSLQDDRSAMVQSTWEIPAAVPRLDFDPQSFLGILEDAIRSQTPTYFVPVDRNFPTIDSVFYKPGECLHAIQITEARNHPEKTFGFKHLQGYMKLKSLAHPLQPSGSEPWHLFFVVPNGMASTFAKQAFVGTDTDVKVWGTKIKQFVVELPREEVLKPQGRK